jgi:hypothetical protein
MLSHSFSLLALWHGKVETNVLKYGTRNDEISHIVAMHTQHFLSRIRIYSSVTFSIIFNPATCVQSEPMMQGSYEMPKA